MTCAAYLVQVIEEQEAANDENVAVCPQCDSYTSEPMVLTVAVGRYGAVDGGESSQCCQRCVRNGRFLPCEDLDGAFAYFGSVTAVYGGDEEHYYTTDWARANAVYDDFSGNWYLSREDFPERPRPEASGGLYEYSTDVLEVCEVDARSFGKKVVMGFELEMEAPQADEDEDGYPSDSDRENLIDQCGGPCGEDYILKHDGSLDYGIELVTVPYTLSEHRARDWGKTLSKFSNRGCQSSTVNTCGFHVHVNKRALTPLVIGKMLVFLNNVSTRRFVEVVGQRQPNSYCRASAKKISDSKKRTEKYEVLNIKGSTVELRFFKGNLNPKRVLKNLEFTHALVMFCRQCSIKDSENHRAFLAYITSAAHKATYPNLIEFLTAKGVL
jgi:hypothetical protein